MTKKLNELIAQPEIKNRLADALEGSAMSVDEFAVKCLTAFAKKPKRGKRAPSECTPQTKLAVIHELACLNLAPVGDQVALIPREQNGAIELTFILQWQGMKALIDRSPLVFDTTVIVVHESEQYEYDPDTRQAKVVYDPLKRPKFKSIDDIQGGILIIQYEDRTRPDKHVFVPHDHFVKARACAKSKEVWDSWLYEQAHKTVYRYAYARREVPVDPRLSGMVDRAIEADDRYFENDPSRLNPVVDVKPRRVVRKLADLIPVTESTDVVEGDQSDAQETEPLPADMVPTISEPLPQPTPEDYKALSAKLKKARSVSGAQKAALEWASAFALTDEDDIWLSDTLADRVTELTKNDAQN